MISILEAPDCHTNSPCEYNRNCKENCVENMNANVSLVQRVMTMKLIRIICKYSSIYSAKW